jgi:8-hydroxy-5-deazaflavin:NADPH oxidoreductase
MSIAVIGGTGDEGFALALRLGRAGEEVVIGSRAEERGKAAAEEASELLGRDGPRVRGASNQDAARTSDVVFVTVPYAGQAEIYRSIKESIRPESIVCDTTTPLATAVGGRPWQILTPWAGSAAEQAKALLPAGIRLVSGFHTISSDALRDLLTEMHGDVLLCGNDADAKARVGSLVERIPGLRWVDVGPLSMARIIEPLTALMISVNRTYHAHGAGVSVTGRDSWGMPPGKAPREPGG